MMKRLILFALCGTVILGTQAGCAKRVTRIGVEEVRDLSGRWNDTDSRLVAEEMIRDSLSHPWLTDFMASHGGKKPVIIVGRVRNKSHEHINTETFVIDLQRAITNSGRASFVASSEEREDIRGERMDQDVNASEETRKAPGKESGADFMLSGSINTIFDEDGRDRVAYYQVDLVLSSMADNRQVWFGDKKIKKFIERGSLRY
ncbi:MAG TPA: penicillin-binding protein activator LpoB [Geobacterales bacterium]|nr:penicillin-binding protein activator LpoB [Geobacterales bacterium]